MKNEKNVELVEQVTVQLVDSPVCHLSSNWMPSINAVGIINRAIELFSIPENYVAACKYLIDNGYPIDLHWRPEFRKEWETELYKIEFHKPHKIRVKGKEITAYTPFEPAVEPQLPEFKDSLVVKVSMRSDVQFGNTMKALHYLRPYGVFVTKKKREAKSISQVLLSESMSKFRHKEGKITLADEVKIGHLKGK